MRGRTTRSCPADACAWRGCASNGAADAHGAREPPVAAFGEMKSRGGVRRRGELGADDEQRVRRTATRSASGETPGTSTTTSTADAVSRTSSGGRHSALMDAAPGTSRSSSSRAAGRPRRGPRLLEKRIRHDIPIITSAVAEVRRGLYVRVRSPGKESGACKDRLLSRAVLAGPGVSSGPTVGFAACTI